MAINLWTSSGLPSGYSPLPTGWGNALLNLPRKEYVISFRAKSATGKTAIIGLKDIKLTSEMTTYSYEVNFSATNFHFYYDGASGASDIIIEDIVLIEKPLGKATLNGLDGFGKVKDGMTGKIYVLTDFKNKIQGSTVENPHSAFTVLTNVWSPPTSTTGRWDWSNAQLAYDQISTLNGTTKSISMNTSGYRAGILMSFDVIAEVEKNICQQIPASDLAGKVQWVRNNISSIVNRWYGFGTSSVGNRAWIAVWHATSNAWTTGWNNHTSSGVQGMATNVNANLQDRIDANGMIHFMAYADPADGTTQSVIHTDYVSLEINMKQSSVLDSKWVLHPSAKIIDEETLELNSTVANCFSYGYVNVEKASQVRLDAEISAGANFRVRFLDSNSNVIGSSLYGQNNQPITIPVGTKTLEVGFYNHNEVYGTYTLKRPMLVLGKSPVPYEPKRGERMVEPITVRNLASSQRLNNAKDMIYTYVGQENGYDKYSIKGTWASGTYPYSCSFSSHQANFRPSVSYSVGVQIYTNVPHKYKDDFGKITLVNDGAMTGTRKISRDGYYSTITDVIHSTTTHALNPVYIYSCPVADGTVFNPDTDFLYVKELQIEEGKVANPYVPYGQFKLNDGSIKDTPIKNLFDKRKSTSGYFVNTGTGGLAISGLGQSSSDFIPVEGSTVYAGSGIRSAVGSSGGIGIAYYNQSKSYIGGLSYDNGKSLGNLITPSTAKFVRFTFMGTDIDLVQFEKGATSTEFKEYELGNKRIFGLPKNYVPKSDFKELSMTTAGLATPLTSYGSGGYSISDDVYIPNTKSQRIEWTSPANNGVGMLNRGLRLTLSDTEFSNMVVGESYILSFYGKGWEPNGGVGYYSVNLSNTFPLAREDMGNGWYRYAYRFRYASKDGIIYIRPNNNTDYSYDCLMNGLQIEPYLMDDKPTAYKPFRIESKKSRRGLEFDGNSRITVNHSNLDGFDVETEFVWYGVMQGFNYSMLWSLNGNANYVAIRSSDKSLFVSTKSQGGVQQARSLPLTIVEGVKYRIRVVYDPTDFTVKTYNNGILINTYQEIGKIQTDSKSAIGSLNTGLQSSPFKGAILSQELKDVYKLDFTNQDLIMGTKVKAITGLDGTIIGNPSQLNKRAKR